MRFDFLAKTPEAFHSLVAHAETRLKGLVEQFELVEQSVSVRPWPRRIKFEDPNWPFSEALFFGLKFKYEKADKVGEKKVFDLRQPIVYFVDEIARWEDKHRFPDEYDMLVRHLARKDLPPWCLDEDTRGQAVEGGGGAQDAVADGGG